MASSFRVIQHIVNGCHTRDHIAATVNGDDDTPKLSVEQYIPLDNLTPKPGDLTIIGAHANGFPKEMYEPLWEDIYQRASQTGIRIRSIWIADMWNQGQSGVLNEKILGNDHPVIQIPNGSIPPAISSTPRRDIWPSREAAAARFRGSRFFQAWDPRVLDRWIEHGLRQVPTELHPAQDTEKDERVTLTTSKHQELFTFLRPTYRMVPGEEYLDKDPVADEEYPGYPFYRPEPLQVFQRLPELRPSVLYIFGETSELSSLEQREAKMAKTGTGVGGSGGAATGRVKQIVLDCGHLVAMERVTECADAVIGFLGGELDRWQQEKEEFEKYWKKQSRKEQITIDNNWADRVNPNAMRPSRIKL
ncbi:hypothetical protein ACHAP7_010521 [Fusarium lateritium]